MRLIAAIALGLAIAASSAAQQMPAPLDAVVPQPGDLRVTRLAGRPVQDTAGRRIGRVDDLILDATVLRQHFLAVSGTGTRKHRLYFPLYLFRIGENRQAAIEVEGARGRLAEASRAPELRRPASRFVAASEILGRPVRGPDGAPAGVLGDLVVNVESGNVRYAVLTHARNGGGKMALPLLAFELAPPHGGDLRLVMRPQPAPRPRGDPISEMLFGALLAPDRQ